MEKICFCIKHLSSCCNKKHLTWTFTRRDASYGWAEYSITILDCLNAIDKALKFNFFDFNDFDFNEYEFFEVGPVDMFFSYKLGFYQISVEQVFLKWQFLESNNLYSKNTKLDDWWSRPHVTTSATVKCLAFKSLRDFLEKSSTLDSHFLSAPWSDSRLKMLQNPHDNTVTNLNILLAACGEWRLQLDHSGQVHRLLRTTLGQERRGGPAHAGILLFILPALQRHHHRAAQQAHLRRVAIHARRFPAPRPVLHRRQHALWPHHGTLHGTERTDQWRRCCPLQRCTSWHFIQIL